jgi:ATP-dependent Clp protease ATP-binding subunit ClpC
MAHTTTTSAGLYGGGDCHMSSIVELNSLRAAQARFSSKLGKPGYQILLVISLLCLLGAIAAGYFLGLRLGLVILALAIIFWLPAIWWKRYLSILPASDDSLTGRLSVDVLSRLNPKIAMQPQTVWEALSDHWQASFFVNHLLLDKASVKDYLATDESDFQQALKIADQIAKQNNSPVIELGFVVAGLMLSSLKMQQLLLRFKAQPEDVKSMANWLARNLNDDRKRKKFGGVGRDWAFGFTPLLDRLGQNISLAIAKHGAHFDWMMQSAGVKAIEAAFSNHASAIVLIGPDGIGKTNSVYALAQKLIEGETVKELAYHQIIEINATDITSRARGQGDLEQIMISIANEAAHAGHVILFLDNAQLFTTSGPGSFDATQILLSIVQARSVPMILAMSPSDFQRLRNNNQSLANLLTPVVLQEPSEADVMRILEDTSVNIENRNHVLVAYESLREAYRLSGRYNQDEAYPGRAVKLLEQAVSHTDHSVLSIESVQKAIEQTRGVKVSSAAPAEADALLHLEDQIHKRMINQSHAVSVVANALRRARAGVTNPRRPIGSFLFLGPTGVGKTELAKSVAATYFGSEASMIRIDMSEYQQPDDTQRLLATGQAENASLLMSIRQQPFSVVLLDEIEKAHPNILNLMLQLLDEGQLTDLSGKVASFKDCVIIATSNAGANTIRERIAKGENLDSFAAELTDELISNNQFRPELLNRFDEMVLFRPLNESELAQVVSLMIGEVNGTLKNQNISIELTQAAIAKIVAEGNDPRLGARPMRRALQRIVENTLAQKILKGEAKPGDHVVLDDSDLLS